MAEKYIPYDGTASPGDFQDGAIIDSTHFTNEFDQLGLAFGTGGHNHDGTAGSGPKIGSGGIVTSDTYDMAGLVVDSLTITSGTAVTSIDTDLSAVSATDNTLASAKAIKTYVDAQVTASDLDFQGDSGGALSIDLDSETLTIAGGTGLSTTGSGNTLTVDIDSTVATLTGTQTLSNKTLSSPSITGNLTTNGTIDGRDVATDGGKLDGIEAEATADQTAEEIRSLVESATDSNVFTDADHTKLNGIEAGADVTDSTNVQSAGALMDSEVTNLAQVKAFSSADYATAAQGTTADSALQPTDNISELTNDSGYITGNQTITLSGDATGSGTTAITVDLAANTVGVNELNLTDGTAGQFLKTDGSGTISFADAPTQATSFTTLDVDNLNLDGNTVSATSGGIILYTEGNGTFNLSAGDGGGFGNPNVVPTLYFTDRASAGSSGTLATIGQINFQAPDVDDINTIAGKIITKMDPASASKGSMQLAVVRNGFEASSLGTGITIDGSNATVRFDYANISFNSSAYGGIDFSVSPYTDGAGMNNELLDDYEEGGWIPNFSDGTTTVTTGGTRIGKYVKVGQMVTAWASISNGQTGSLTSTASLRITGLPFVGENANAIEKATSSTALLEGVSYTTDPVIYLTNNGNRDYVTIWDQGAGTSIKVSDVTSGTNSIAFTLTYLAG